MLKAIFIMLLSFIMLSYPSSIVISGSIMHIMAVEHLHVPDYV